MTDEATMLRLIDAAEGRFAESGIGHASLRGIMRDADTDPGAVHYHFGNRRTLAEAVLDRVLAPLNTERLRRLTAIEAPDLPELVDCLIGPDLEIAQQMEGRGAGRARLLGSIYLHPVDYVEARVADHFRPVAERFQPELIRLLPAVTPDELAWRVRWVVFGTLGALLLDPSAPFREQPSTARRLTDACVGALTAPERGSA